MATQKRTNSFQVRNEIIENLNQVLAQHKAKPREKLSALEFVKEELLRKHYPELLEQYYDLLPQVSAPPPKCCKQSKRRRLVSELYGGRIYEYYPLGEYIVAAPGVCGGRPTIKYHRLDARHIIGYLKSGETREALARNFKIPVEAIDEAVKLAEVYNYERSYA